MLWNGPLMWNRPFAVEWALDVEQVFAVEWALAVEQALDVEQVFAVEQALDVEQPSINRLVCAF